MIKRATTLVAASALVWGLAACGGDGDDEPTTSTGQEDLGDVVAVEGCGEGSYTDPEDTSPDRPAARCEPGAPAPQPLDETTTVTMSLVAHGVHVAPVYLADAMGEFEAENLDVEMVTMSFADAMPQLTTGQLDIAYGGTEGGFFNAVDQGMDIDWVLGNFTSPDAGNSDVPQSGMWARRDVFSDPENPDVSELKGHKFGSAVGPTSSATYPIEKTFRDAGLSLADVEISQFPGADLFTALENDALAAAWLLDPYWVPAAEKSDEYVLVGTGAPGEPLGGIYIGKNMKEQPEVMQAFARAYIRAINTYLDGDYREDAEVVGAISEATGQPEDTITRVPPLLFDWEMRVNTGQRLQEYFIDLGVVEFDEVMPDEDYVDRSYYERAVGWDGS